MAADLLAKSRSLVIATMLALAAAGAGGCSSEAPSDANASADDITNVDHTAVKRQSIGNCWIYATASWAEALNKAATGEAKNTSESWLTYWHWFDELTRGTYTSEIETGGWFSTGVSLIDRYGIVLEADFIPSEGDAEMSGRQSQALEAINARLKSGELSEAIERRDRKAIRAALDRAWQLDEATIARIDAVFGKDVSRTLDASADAVKSAADNKVITASAFPARVKDSSTGAMINGSLADALGSSQGDGPFAKRVGKFAWNTAFYPSRPAERRQFWKRVQRALHDNQPVVISWMIDFNALSRSSVVSLAELKSRGPGRQGGHLTVMHDYQAEVPGIGLLEAGKQATPEQMDRALADETKIQFVRVKNSWGGLRPDRWDSAAISGYHDLELAYLDGPIKRCRTNEKGETDTSKCESSMVPLQDIVLPAGY